MIEHLRLPLVARSQCQRSRQHSACTAGVAGSCTASCVLRWGTARTARRHPPEGAACVARDLCDFLEDPLPQQQLAAGGAQVDEANAGSQAEPLQQGSGGGRLCGARSGRERARDESHGLHLVACRAGASTDPGVPCTRRQELAEDGQVSIAGCRSWPPACALAAVQHAHGFVLPALKRTVLFKQRLRLL